MPKLTKDEQSKIGARSRRKGVTFEQLLARLFTDWWGSSVQRTPMSGAYKNREFELNGDLMFSRNDPFPFHVEAKKREKWCADNLFDKNTEVFEWWDECWREAEYHRKLPLLIMARNLYGPYAMLHWSDFTRVGVVGNAELLHLNLQSGAVVVMKLDEFFRTVDQKSVRAIQEARTDSKSPIESKEIDFS